jgi:glycosyltransferase involved in cell wall biosynthesis
VPGLANVHQLTLPRRELRAAWQHGLTTKPLGGMIHAPTLLAPLSRHDRRDSPGEQTVVTIHDAAPWLFPESGNSQAAWVRHMAKRAKKHADAIVVPTHATADDLSRYIDFGERIRVIAGAVSDSVRLPDDADDIAARLALPDEYLITVGTLEPRKAVEALFAATALPGFPDIPLLFVGPETWGERTVEQAIADSGAAAGMIRHIPPVPDAELAVLIDRATLAVAPSTNEGSGLTAIEALHFGTPLVHSDASALVEVVAGAGVTVEIGDLASYPERLAQAIADTLDDTDLLRRLGITGADRSRAFSWRDSAERVWQLHADL